MRTKWTVLVKLVFVCVYIYICRNTLVKLMFLNDVSRVFFCVKPLNSASLDSTDMIVRFGQLNLSAPVGGIGIPFAKSDPQKPKGDFCWREAFLQTFPRLQICPPKNMFGNNPPQMVKPGGSNYWWNQGLAAWFRAKSTTLFPTPFQDPKCPPPIEH